ncbi:uncharacterized protein EDB91DRAFT_1291397 [Suillus paluster]|uniref:uncharacterized protein n=1 Tax=Suillus paluster TaxID=48578 RepID=UPI001B884575|nr:uncharacterized protein EDB91DRAFT_1291397 [Suillus paluster]KAG1736866.1 hypothetical protein EDB91DRAFT_1291397 [Suillus paluster]
MPSSSSVTPPVQDPAMVSQLVPSPTLLVPLRASKMSKLDIPTFSGPLEPAAINGWLGCCEDSYLAWSALNAGQVMPPQLRIVLAGLKLDKPSTSLWWSENHDVLKLLATWEAFALRFKDHFIPSGWRLDALAHFYAVSQGNSNFRSFVANLQAARNTLGSAGLGYTISNSVFKNHLLFCAQSILQLRVCTIPNLGYENLKVDALINVMATTWSSLVAEGLMKSLPTRPMSTTPSTSTMPRPKPAYPLPDLSYAEREALRSAGGCFHCRLSPSDTTWKPHIARECPGDQRRGIPSCAPHQATTVAAVTIPEGYKEVFLTHGNPGVTDFSDPNAGLIATLIPHDVVMLSCVLEGGSDSDDSEEDDYGYGY